MSVQLGLSVCSLMAAYPWLPIASSDLGRRGSLKVLSPFCGLSVAELARGFAFGAEEELAEGGGTGKVQTVGNLGNGEGGGAEQEGGFHE